MFVLLHNPNQTQAFLNANTSLGLTPDSSCVLIPTSPGFKGFGEASVELARTSVGLLLELGEDDMGAVTVEDKSVADGELAMEVHWNLRLVESKL